LLLWDLGEREASAPIIGDLDAYESVRQAMAKSQAERRLSAIELLLHAHIAEHGQPPKSLEELSAENLPGLPNDPFTDDPFVYRASGGTYQFYSVGPDGKDDGGEAIDDSAYYDKELPRGDLSLGEL
jgi:hypothetical protein